MARIGSMAVQALAGYLRGSDGLPDRIAKLTAASQFEIGPITAVDILERQVAADIAEKTSGVRYPAVHIYCPRIVNDLREKFRTFSGTADLTVEMRVSHEHMDDLQAMLQTFVEAVTDILDKKRGRWVPGVFYTGGYTVQFGPIKRGGRNFLQAAKVELTINISME
jgi:hypothetical protein